MHFSGRTICPATLLVVDDESCIHGAIATAAAMSTGVRVLHAFDANLALRLARTHKPDAILLDIMLAGEDGRDVLAQLKADPATSEIPIIVLSAKAEQHMRHVVFDLGAADFFEKPLDALHVLGAIRKRFFGQWTHSSPNPLRNNTSEGR